MAAPFLAAWVAAGLLAPHAPLLAAVLALVGMAIYARALRMESAGRPTTR